jgi:hypothetical protein
MRIMLLWLKQWEHKNNEDCVAVVRQSEYKSTGGSVAIIKAVLSPCLKQSA